MLQVSDTTNKYLMTRSAHIATENLVSIKLAFSNFYNSGSAGGNPQQDTGQGAASTITAAIEYNGTFTQVTFSASSSGSIPDASVLFSDYISVNIPASATFWIRSFVHNTAGLFYNSHQNSFLGESTALSVTAITDQTMGGTITNSGSFSFPPIAILGMTVNPSVIIVGDSVGAGFNDTEDSSSSATGWNAKIGLIARSLASVPFLNLSVSGETAQSFIAHATARALLIQKGSHLVTQLGINDFQVNGRTAAQVTSDMQTIWALKWAQQKVFQSTITPDPSDPGTPQPAYTTLTQQTPFPNDAARVTFNTSARAIITGSNGYYDMTSGLESSLNSGKWTVTPSPPYAGGAHPNASGYAVIAAANLIPAPSYP